MNKVTIELVEFNVSDIKLLSISKRGCVIASIEGISPVLISGRTYCSLLNGVKTVVQAAITADAEPFKGKTYHRLRLLKM